jgi:hypothetical protein
MAITSTSVSSLSGQGPFKRKFKLQLGGTTMPGTRGKRKSSMSRGKKSSTRGKKKRR